MVANPIDKNGRPSVTEDQAIEILLRGHNLSDYCFEKSKFEEFQRSVETWGVDYLFNLCEEGEWKVGVTKRSEKWLIVSDRNIVNYLVEKCPEENIERVLGEIAVFEKHKLLPLLARLCDFVEMARKNNIVIGVGRGSSVSSYCLYLIGLHRIDSVAYGLDFSEFMS
jgi:DNA polymerase III alpha subunit